MGVHAQVPGMRSMEAVRTVWRTAAAVCFDVDSTIVSEEGIDVLAAHCGAGEAVAEWTARAMGGGIPFEVALEERLKLIQPSRAAVEACINAHPLPLTPGVAELVNALRKSGKRVFLVSGGFRQMIVPVAKALEIPMEDVFANDLLFDEGARARARRARHPSLMALLSPGVRVAAHAHAAAPRDRRSVRWLQPR